MGVCSTIHFATHTAVRPEAPKGRLMSEDENRETRESVQRFMHLIAKEWASKTPICRITSRRGCGSPTSRTRLRLGCVWVASGCTGLPYSADRRVEIVRIPNHFARLDRLLICGLKVRFLRGSSISLRACVDNASDGRLRREHRSLKGEDVAKRIRVARRRHGRYLSRRVPPIDIAASISSAVYGRPGVTTS
jgi:hypothetical protein